MAFSFSWFQQSNKNTMILKSKNLNLTPEMNPSFLIYIHATILPLRHIWSRTAGPGRAPRTPGWPYSLLRRWYYCCSSPWSEWNTCQRFWSAATWSSGPAGAGFVAAGQSVQKPQSWYIQASSQIFVSRWLPSDSNSTARYPSQREKSTKRGGGRGEKEKSLWVFLNARNCFCVLIDTMINHPEGLLSSVFDRGDKS